MSIITEIFKTNDVKTWKVFINRIKSNPSIDKLAISVALAKNIPILMSEIISNDKAKDWLLLWKNEFGNCVEFDISLEMLDSVIKYKISNGNRKYLMSLPQELRTLVEIIIKQNP